MAVMFEVETVAVSAAFGNKCELLMGNTLVEDYSLCIVLSAGYSSDWLFSAHLPL